MSSAGQNNKGLATRISFLLIVCKGQAAGRTPLTFQETRLLSPCTETGLLWNSPAQTLSFTDNIQLALGLPSPLSQAGITGGFPRLPSIYWVLGI